jgi:hypothetical protein
MVLVFFSGVLDFEKCSNYENGILKKCSILNCSILEKCSDLKTFSDFENCSYLKCYISKIV